MTAQKLANETREAVVCEGSNQSMYRISVRSVMMEENSEGS
jgi:hypothetical protein